MPPVFKGYRDVQQNRIAHRGRGRIPGDWWKMSFTKFDLYCFQQVAWTSVFTCIIYFKDSKDVPINGTAPFSPMHSTSPVPHHSACNYPEKIRYNLFSLHSVFEDRKTVWRSFETLWLSCRNVTVKLLPFPRLNIPGWLSFLHVTPPCPFLFHHLGAGSCHMDNVILCIVSLRYGEVAWESPVLRGISET